MYTWDMAKTLNRNRPKVGSRLLEFRQAAGLSQYDLAKKIGVYQQTVAYWEQSDKPPRSEVLPLMAKVLGVKVEDILGVKATSNRKGGPKGKVKETFEAVSKLPRRKQQQIIQVVEALVAQHS